MAEIDIEFLIMPIPIMANIYAIRMHNITAIHASLYISIIYVSRSQSL